MTEYIKRSDAIMAVTRAKLPDKTTDGIPIANGKRSVTDCIRRIRAIPAADMRNFITKEQAVEAAWSVIESLGYSSKYESGWRLVEELRGALDDIEQPKEMPVRTVFYDTEEIHPNCTVQVWRNSVTGEVSVGWWENDPNNDNNDEIDGRDDEIG